MDILLIRTLFVYIYTYLCKIMNCPIRDDVWLAMSDRIPPHACMCVYMEGLYPKIAIRESDIISMSLKDICQLLAHESLHIILFDLRLEYRDSTQQFNESAKQLGINTNQLVSSDSFDFTKIIRL